MASNQQKPFVPLAMLYENVSKTTGDTYFSGYLGQARVFLFKDKNAEPGKPSWSLLVQQKDPKPDQGHGGGYGQQGGQGYAGQQGGQGYQSNRQGYPQGGAQQAHQGYQQHGGGQQGYPQQGSAPTPPPQQPDDDDDIPF